MKTKRCTHCGGVTHPQPQDYDHDTGFGHCYSCLGKSNWYVPSVVKLSPELELKIWEHRDSNNGPLTSDDSHAKVIEIFLHGKLESHQTRHEPKDVIFARILKIIPQQSNEVQP